MQNPLRPGLVSQKEGIDIELPLLPLEIPHFKMDRDFPPVRQPLIQLRRRLFDFSRSDLGIQSHLDSGLCHQTSPGTLQRDNFLAQLTLQNGCQAKHGGRDQAHRPEHHDQGYSRRNT